MPSEQKNTKEMPRDVPQGNRGNCSRFVLTQAGILRIVWVLVGVVGNILSMPLQNDLSSDPNSLSEFETTHHLRNDRAGPENQTILRIPKENVAGIGTSLALNDMNHFVQKVVLRPSIGGSTNQFTSGFKFH